MLGNTKSSDALVPEEEVEATYEHTAWAIMGNRMTLEEESNETPYGDDDDHSTFNI